MKFGVLAIQAFIAFAGTTIATEETVEIISRDVVVIGGGSSGVYTGIRLQDAGKSVAVIEPKSTIGGHAETYVDPTTGLAINMGVQVFHNDNVTTEWFKRWNVTLIPSSSSSSGSNTSYVDFTTGKVNTGFSPPSNVDFGTALGEYAAILSQWPAVQLGFNLTYPVDADLLLPFGEFLVKHNLTALSYNSFLFAQGYAPLMNLTSLYVFKNFGLPLIQDLSGPGLLTTASHNTHELYDNILAAEPSLFMLNTTATSISRLKTGGVQVTVQSSTGRTTIINAKKLVWTAPPTISNFDAAGFVIRSTERALFSQLSPSGYYTGIIKNSGLPDGAVLSASSPSAPFGIGASPGPYQYTRIPGTDLTSIYYASEVVLDDEKVKADIFACLALWKMQNGGSVEGETSPEWAAFHSHAPFNLMVGADSIADGFYELLYALQGVEDVFYNGAAWTTQDSGVLWDMTESWILPIVLASL